MDSTWRQIATEPRCANGQQSNINAAVEVAADRFENLRRHGLKRATEAVSLNPAMMVACVNTIKHAHKALVQAIGADRAARGIRQSPNVLIVSGLVIEGACCTPGQGRYAASGCQQPWIATKSWSQDS